MNEKKKIKKTQVMRYVEIILQIPIEEWLSVEYEKYKLNTRQIATKLFKLTGQRVNYVTIARWLKYCGIKARKQCWE